MRVGCSQCDIERCASATARRCCFPCFSLRRFGRASRGTIEQDIDRCGDEFDVADLLDPDALNQVLERLRIAARIEALKKILHHRAHFPKLTTEAFLENVCGCRIGFVGSDGIDQLLNMEKHTCLVIAPDRPRGWNDYTPDCDTPIRLPRPFI